MTVTPGSFWAWQGGEPPCTPRYLLSARWGSMATAVAGSAAPQPLLLQPTCCSAASAAAPLLLCSFCRAPRSCNCLCAPQLLLLCRRCHYSLYCPCCCSLHCSAASATTGSAVPQPPPPRPLPFRGLRCSAAPAAVVHFLPCSLRLPQRLRFRSLRCSAAVAAAAPTALAVVASATLPQPLL